MKFILTTLLLMTILFVNAQLKVANSSLLELEKNIYQKEFSKKWKKLKQTDWELKCNSSKTIEELNVLFNEYSDLMAQTINFSMGNVDAKSELEFCQYLLKVEGTLNADITSKWAVTDRTNWRKSIQEYITKEELVAQKQKEEELMRKFQVVTSIVKSFDTNFPLVWEDSKKNSFKSYFPADAKTDIDITTIKFKGTQSQKTVVDGFGVRSFKLTYDAENDPQLSSKIMAELEVIILSTAGAGYKKTNEHDGNYTNNNKFVIQFEGEKFSETAKKPTVTIGVVAATNVVFVEITEPVFGH